MEKQGDDVQSTTSRDDILLRSPEREQDDVRKAREQDGVPFNTTATHAMLLKTNARGAMAGDTAEQYPPLSTKLLVGIGLFLAVFLVGLDQTIVATALPKISDHFNSLNDVGWYASAFFLTMYLPQLPSEIARIGLACADCRTALQPTFGKLYQVFNVKTVFLVALAVFELGSLICGLAPTSATLIAGRAIAGSGAAVNSPPDSHVSMRFSSQFLSFLLSFFVPPFLVPPFLICTVFLLAFVLPSPVLTDQGIVAGAFTVVGYIVPLRQRPIYFASILGANAVASIVGPLAGGAFTDHVTWRWWYQSQS